MSYKFSESTPLGQGKITLGHQGNSLVALVGLVGDGGLLLKLQPSIKPRRLFIFP